MAPARCATAVSTEITRSAQRNHRRRVGEILKLAADMRHAAFACERRRILAAHVALNADKACRTAENSGASRANAIERLRSLIWLELPDQAMAMRGRAQRADPRRPFGQMTRRRRKGKEFAPAPCPARSATPAAGCRAGNARRTAAALRRAR